jgi:hypothetical protein
MRSIDWLKESYLAGRFNLETYRRLLSADPHGEQRMHKAWLTEVSSGLYTLCLKRMLRVEDESPDVIASHILGLFTEDELRLLKDVLNTKFK